MKLLEKLKLRCRHYLDRICDKHTPFHDASKVTRFINSKKAIKRGNDGKLTSTPDAFMYPKTEPELSLAHIDKLNNKKIWAIGDNRVFRKAAKKTIARADMKVSELKAHAFDNFTIIRDNEEFWRHVTAKTSMEKQQWATQLSLLATLFEKSAS